MSSTIAYDPDEFDNNPFAEPVGSLAVGATAIEPGLAVPEESTEVSNTDTIEQEGDKPIESEEARTTYSKTSLVPERYDDKDAHKIAVKVIALERSGSLSNKKENPAVIFDLSTNIPHFRKKMYKGVKKSYSEFMAFWKFLNGANPECFVPALPLSSTNFGIQNEEDYKRTSYNFQAWFNRITSNPLIVRNEEFVFFVEGDFGTYAPIHKSELPATGLKRKTLKQFQPPYDEILDLAEFRPLIKSIYQNSKTLIERLEKLTKFRKQLGQHENELGTKITELSILEGTHPGMQNMWKKIGKTLTFIGDLDSVIGSVDLATLGDGLQGVINDGYIIKEALTNRHLLMRELINAQANTKIKHENARKLKNKRDINPIKVDEAIRALEDATNYEDELSKKIKRITEEMLIEKKEYLEYLDEQIKLIFKDFVIRRIEHERRKLKVLEKVRVDVRLVDENGGLARLGRERYPVKEIVSTSSQGPEGDSWSGDRKVSHLSSDLFRDEEADDIPEPEQEEGLDETPIDARNAASLLGGSTF
jgi:hypothetical protein